MALPYACVVLHTFLLCCLCLKFANADKNTSEVPGFCASHSACPPHLPTCVAGTCTISSETETTPASEKSLKTCFGCQSGETCNPVSGFCVPECATCGSGGDGGNNNPSGCFAATSTVERVSVACAHNSWNSWVPSSAATFESCVERVSLRQLKLGDLIRSVSPKGMSPYFEPVIDLSHSTTDFHRTSLVQLRADDHTLTLTRDHMLYVQKLVNIAQAVAPKFQGSQLIPAEEVVFGDKIGVLSESSSELKWIAVEEIKIVVTNGVRNVWTRSGRLIVNGVLASPFRAETYGPYLAVQQSVGHLASVLGLSQEDGLTWPQAVVHTLYMGGIEAYVRLADASSLPGVLALLTVVMGLTLQSAALTSVIKNWTKQILTFN